MLLKSIVAAAVILLGARGEGLAREVVYGYYTSLFEPDDSKPPSVPPSPEIYFSIFPPELWHLILKDLSAYDLSNIAKVCKGLENVTRQIDRSYIPRLAYQSGNLTFFKNYMLSPILGLKPSFSPLQDLYNLFGSYKAIYEDSYMIGVFSPEHVVAHNEAVKKIEQGLKDVENYGNDDEQQDKKLRKIKDIMRAANTFIFPFQYNNSYGEIKSIIELCRTYKTDYYFINSFYYPLSSSQALWNMRLYMNPHLLLLISKASLKPQVPDLSIMYMPITQSPLWLAQMTTLANLNLYDTSLSKLPMELSSLQNLRRLSLAQNKFIHIPLVISTFTKLDDLDLSNNLIKDLNTEAECLRPLANLDRLILYNNNIIDINFLSKLTHLTNLGGVYLRDNKVRSIPEWVTSLRGPKDKKLTLNLRGNSLWAAFIRDWVLPYELLPSAKQRPEYNLNPQVKVITD